MISKGDAAFESADAALEASVLGVLESKGVLASMRAQLRLCVAEAIEGEARRAGRPSVIGERVNPRRERFLASGDALLVLSLVDDLLHCSGLEATRSLLHTEADLASGACKGPGELCAELGVAAATGEAVLHSALRALRAANAPPPLPSPVKAPARVWDGLDKGYGAPSGDTPLTTGIGAFAGTLPHTGSRDGGMSAGPVDVDDVDAIGDLVHADSLAPLAREASSRHDTGLTSSQVTSLQGAAPAGGPTIDPFPSVPDATSFAGEVEHDLHLRLPGAAATGDAASAPDDGALQAAMAPPVVANGTSSSRSPSDDRTSSEAEQLVAIVGQAHGAQQQPPTTGAGAPRHLGSNSRSGSGVSAPNESPLDRVGGGEARDESFSCSEVSSGVDGGLYDSSSAAHGGLDDAAQLLRLSRSGRGGSRADGSSLHASPPGSQGGRDSSGMHDVDALLGGLSLDAACVDRAGEAPPEAAAAADTPPPSTAASLPPRPPRALSLPAVASHAPLPPMASLPAMGGGLPPLGGSAARKTPEVLRQELLSTGLLATPACDSSPSSDTAAGDTSQRGDSDLGAAESDAGVADLGLAQLDDLDALAPPPAQRLGTPGAGAGESASFSDAASVDDSGVNSDSALPLP